MSDFAPALSYVLDFEDRPRSYEPSPDTGGEAIAGVNSKAWPVDYAHIASLPQPERASAVSDFYQKNFWNPLLIGGIAAQEVANRVLDESVNAGPKEGPMILQKACNSLGCTLTVDGELGPHTLAAANVLDPVALLIAYRRERAAHYKAIEMAHPEDVKYDAVWMARAEA